MTGNGNGRLSWEKMAEGLRRKVQEHSEYQTEVREKFLAAVPFLTGDQDPVEFVGLMKEVRSAGILSESIQFFLLALGLEKVSEDRFDETYGPDFAERFGQLQEQLGIDEDDEDFHVDDAPEEYQALNREYGEMSERTFAMVCREFGEGRLAELYEKDRAEFDRLREEGREAVHGPIDEEEIERIVEAVDRARVSDDDDTEPDGGVE